jgi:hypothetical protein
LAAGEILAAIAGMASTGTLLPTVESAIGVAKNFFELLKMLRGGTIEATQPHDADTIQITFNVDGVNNTVHAPINVYRLYESDDGMRSQFLPPSIQGGATPAP